MPAPDDFDGLDDPTAAPGAGQDRRDDPPAPAEPASASAPARGAAALGERLRAQLARLKRLREGEPLRFYLLLGGVALAVVLVAAVAGSALRHEAIPRFATKGEGSGAMVLSSRTESEVQSWIQTSGSRLNDLDGDMTRLKADLRRAQEQNDKRLDDIAGKLDQVGALAKAVDDLRTNRLPAAAPAEAPLPRIDELKSELRRLAEEGILSPDSARERLRAWLRRDEPGRSSDEIERLLPGLLTSIGVLNIGNVAEAPASAQEIASLPTSLRPLVGAVRDWHYSRAQAEGRVQPDLEQARRMVREQGIDKASYTDADIVRLASIARVRRENVPSAFESALPELLGQREARGIGRDQVGKIEALVWENRDRLPGMTPGQEATMVDAVARGNGGAAGVRFEPVSDEQRELARQRVREAMAACLAQGIRERVTLLGRGQAALERFLESARRSMASEDRDAVLRAEVAAALGETSAHPAETGAAPGATPARSEPASVRVGGISFLRAQAGYVAWLITPMVADRLGLDPAQPSGAAVVATLWSNAKTIGEAAFDAHADEPLSGRAWLDQVLRQDSELANAAAALANLGLPLRDAPAELAPWLSAVVAGALIGAHAEDAEQAADANRLLRERAGRESLVSGDALTGLAQIPEAERWHRLALIYDHVLPGGVPSGVGRAEAMARLMTGGLRERSVALRRIATAPELGGDAGNLQREVDDALPVVVPAVLANADDQRLAGDELQAIVEGRTAEYAALTVAEGMLLVQVTRQVMRPYESSIEDGRAGAVAITQAIRAWAPGAIAQLFKRNQPVVDDRNLVEVGVTLAQALLPEAERRVVLEIVAARVARTLERLGKALDPHVVEQAVAHVRERAEQVVQPAYTARRMDLWTSQLQQEGIAVLNGDRAALARGAGERPRGASGGAMPKYQDYRRAERGTRAPIGISSVTEKGREIVIPQGTYANAVITGGVATEVGGAGNRPVLLEMPMVWKGPGGSYLVMPKVRLLAEANPLPGPERNSITLRKFSYVFPNGRAVSKNIAGYVVDNVQGMEGALGSFKLNADKILPPALLSGFLEGAGQAAEQGNVTVSQGFGGTTTTTTQTGSPLQRALLGGAGESASIVNEFVRTYLHAVKPTVETPNGQPVTVVLQDDIVFDDLTDDEWNSLTYQRPSAGF